MTTLSIVMPVYNESATIERALERVLAVEYPCGIELVVIDDGSTDLTPQLLSPFADRRDVKIIRHVVNRGKGAAVRTGIQEASGTHVIILDADLEYSPSDIPSMLTPVLTGVADHVFGTRVFGLNTRFPSYRFAMGGRFTTAAANVLFDSCLTDMHTCLKLVPLQDLRRMVFSETGFGLDTELTAKLLRAGVRPYEVPVTYNGRTVLEGKKLSWWDGVECLRILARTRMQGRELVPEPSGSVVQMPRRPVYFRGEASWWRKVWSA
jgi:glycosyltransferase involved in cell wall biosynthesis